MDNGMTPYLVCFLEWSAAMGLSDQTVISRERALNRFITWCHERDLDKPQDITKPILERYRRHLFHYRKKDGEPLGFATQQQRLIPIKAFFKWLSKENHILYNPASELELPKVHKRLPKAILSADEVERILNQTLLHGEQGIRDRAIIETLYSTGIRRMELVNLSLYDVDIKNGTLMVREGKGKKDRMVPLGQRACRWIERYRDEIRPGLVIEPDNSTLFLHGSGEPLKKNRLTDRVKKYIAQAGIGKPGACHLFRHSMATLMLDNGADIRHIQAILGHSQLSTTEIYTQVSIRKLKAVHALTHPADRPRQPEHPDTQA
ncbi:MAG: site-specific tyrosine recombinase XerC [Candidatus Thiodiazotropha sp. (ex Rostrolucina anterorostrata)]|nr:site-specific tyrosine recombinase XerC [Candidatus Thiodiazotropha sp. (ex Rostrolucina anterorostrata)]